MTNDLNMGDGRGRLWAAVQPALDDHPVEPGALGEYAFLRQQRGPAHAERAFPDIAAHVRTGCERCAADLRDFAFELEPQGAFEGVRRIVATLFSPGSLAQADVRGSPAPDMRSYRAGHVAIAV